MEIIDLIKCSYSATFWGMISDPILVVGSRYSSIRASTAEVFDYTRDAINFFISLLGVSMEDIILSLKDI